LRKGNPALLQTANLWFAAVDDDQVIGFVKEGVYRDNAVAVAVALAGERVREFWFHFGNLEIGPQGNRRPVSAIENLITGERRQLEWGGARLRIDPADNPALLFRCLPES
jgi:starch synthase (maltosyl-transferring)